MNRMWMAGGSLFLAACATRETKAPVEDAPAGVPAFYRLDVAGARPADAPRPAPEAPGMRDILTMTFRLIREDGERVAAPRISHYPGQRAQIHIVQQESFVQDFDVEVAQSAFIAEPVVGILHEGLLVEYLADLVPGRPQESAIAFHVTSTRVLRPIPQRGLQTLPAPAPGVTVQLPKTETIDIVGARRLADGVDVELARIPSERGMLSMRGTLTRGKVDGTLDPFPGDEIALEEPSAPPAASPPAASAACVPHEEQPDLARLVRLAASGSAAQRVVADAIRTVPQDARDPLSPRTDDVVSSLSVDTIVVPGIRLRRTLTEAYVKSYEARGPAADPEIGAHTSGLRVEAVDAQKFSVHWTVTPRFDRRRVEVRAGFTADAEVPVSWSEGVEMRPGEDDFLVQLLGDRTNAHVRVRLDPLP